MASTVLIRQHRRPRKEGGAPAAVRAVAAVAALLLVAYVVLGRTHAAFNATTSNGGNDFSAGTVTITDNDSDSAMFSATNLKPGDSVTSCIQVSYTGSLAAAVKMYGSVSASGVNLAPYLGLTVDVGSGAAGFGDCTGFSSTTTIFSNTLSNFAATHTGFSNGLAVWSPSGAEDRWLRFHVTLADDNGAQGADATATFTWEAQST